MLLSFMSFRSCDSHNIKVPLFEDCIMISTSITCVDKRLSNTKIDTIIDGIQALDALSVEDQDELINYFQKNRRRIIKRREFNIPFKYIGYFRGYFLTPPKDRFELEGFMDKNLQELEKYRRKCGDLQDGRMVCNN
jgi:hypothetical protein